jgi:hypothetical protein
LLFRSAPVFRKKLNCLRVSVNRIAGNSKCMEYGIEDIHGQLLIVVALVHLDGRHGLGWLNGSSSTILLGASTSALTYAGHHVYVQVIDSLRTRVCIILLCSWTFADIGTVYLPDSLPVGRDRTPV